MREDERGRECVCVWVCVCVRKREREREKREKRDFIKNARLYCEYNHCNFFVIIFFKLIAKK